MDEKLKILNEQLENCEPAIIDFRDYLNSLTQKYTEFQNLVEYAADIKKDEEEFLKLYRQIASINSTNLVDKLRRKGFALKNSLGNSFENMGYRLLEQTRAGKKDEVYYGLLRIFMVNEVPFPKDLAEAFKPIYSEEMFKVFIFSFLSGVVVKEKQNETK